MSSEHRDVEDRLRRALAARADTVRTEPRALAEIEEKLMTRTPMTDAQRWTVAGVAAAAALVLVAVVVLAGADDGDDSVATGTTTSEVEQTTTTEATTTTTAPERTTTTTFTPAVDAFDVAFPSPDSSQRFDTAASVARAYATEVLGFTELVLGAVEASDAGTEVVVQDRDDGPVTRIQVLEGGDGAWFATGSTTEDITVSQPVPGTSLASPFQTSGEALAFEGTVEVLVLTQTDPAPIGEGIVTGSGTPPPGPFSGDISFTPPPEPTPGILVYRTTSPEDGRVVQATSFHVRLTDVSS